MAEAITTKMITCAGGLPAFVAVPNTSMKVPVVVLLHERYGLVQHTKDLAARHAREGLVCIAADYFFRAPDQDALHRGDVTYPISDTEALEHMNAAIAALADVPQADLSRIVVMGVCQTGRHALVLAAHRKVAAALVWYGAAQDREWQQSERFPVPLADLVAKIECPVLGLFGEKDHAISVDHVRRFRNELEKAGKSFDVEIIGAAPHGWLNDTMPGRYRRDQAEAAWTKQREFLARVFAPGDTPFITQAYKAAIAPDYDFKKNVRYE